MDADTLTPENQSAAVIAYAMMGVLAFLQLLGFTVFECVAKMAQPVSTVHMTKLTAIVVLASLGLFLTCVGDAVQTSQGPSVTAALLHQFGYSFFQGFFAYFLVMSGAPVMGKVVWRNYVYDLAMVAGVAAFLQIPVLLAMVAYPVPEDYTAVMSNVFKVTQAALLVVIGSYALVYFRRRYLRPLKVVRGIENRLTQWGLLACLFSFTGFIISVAVPIETSAMDPDLRTIGTVVVQQLFWNATLASMIVMKVLYSRGLVRQFAGKIVYSRGYAEENPQEDLTEIAKSNVGYGAMA